MRALVFLGSFAASMVVLHTSADATRAFAVLMSACVAAVTCTVLTASGRDAGRRIASNLRVGWHRRE